MKSTYSILWISLVLLSSCNKDDKKTSTPKVEDTKEVEVVETIGKKENPPTILGQWTGSCDFDTNFKNIEVQTSYTLTKEHIVVNHHSYELYSQCKKMIDTASYKHAYVINKNTITLQKLLSTSITLSGNEALLRANKIKLCGVKIWEKNKAVNIKNNTCLEYYYGLSKGGVISYRLDAQELHFWDSSKETIVVKRLQ